jgi:hypothetical protein
MGYLYMTTEKRGPLSWYVLARYLPHVNIFILVHLMIVLVRPKRVVHLQYIG